MWNEVLKSSLVRRMHEFRTVETLLTLALLEEEVALTIPIEGEFSASCAVNTLL